MHRPDERGSAIVIVMLCLAILLVLFTIALRSVYEQHKNNVRELNQVRHAAARLPHDRK